MKTITINTYSFNELSEEAQKVAIENVRNSYYENNDFLRWAIDDCSLLEPQHEELEKLLGENYNFPLIKNTRQIFLSLNRDRYIDISKGAEITNYYHFLKWLGFNDSMIEKINFTIKEDSIEFDNVDYENDLTTEEEEQIQAAEQKFKDHCEAILKRIETDYEYRFTDEAIKEDIESDEIDFLETGEIYN